LINHNAHVVTFDNYHFAGAGLQQAKELSLEEKNLSESGFTIFSGFYSFTAFQNKNLINTKLLEVKNNRLIDRFFLK